MLHVSAIGRLDGGGFGVLRIGPESPSSETDFFALSVARARADAIVSTGSILRAEATVTHDPGPELLDWRRDVLGKPEPPLLAVLTRGDSFPLEHPALRAGRVLIGTSGEGAARLAARLDGRGPEVVALADPSLRGLIADLKRRGHRTLCLEAGPSTSVGLYEPPVAVDELLLSVFEQSPLPDALVAGLFPDPSQLRASLGMPVSEVSRLEASGLWRFRRYVRSPTGGSADDSASP